MVKEILLAALCGAGLGIGGVVAYRKRRAIKGYVRQVRADMKGVAKRTVAKAKRKAKAAAKA